MANDFPRPLIDCLADHLRIATEILDTKETDPDDANVLWLRGALETLKEYDCTIPTRPCAECGGERGAPVGCVSCCLDCGHPCTVAKDTERRHVSEWDEDLDGEA